jgi:hypothetical protein
LHASWKKGLLRLYKKEGRGRIRKERLAGIVENALKDVDALEFIAGIRSTVSSHPNGREEERV